jgi:hypothetical protein
MANNGAQRPLGATGTGLRLGDYALGSPQSRAAARALLERKFAAQKRLEIICSIPRPGVAREINIGRWIEGSDGTLFRTSNIPAGMTIQEAERITSQPGWKPTAPPTKPECTRPPLKPEW